MINNNKINVNTIYHYHLPSMVRAGSISMVHDFLFSVSVFSVTFMCFIFLCSLYWFFPCSCTFNLAVKASGAALHHLHIFDDSAECWFTLRLLLILQTLQKLVVLYTQRHTYACTCRFAQQYELGHWKGEMLLQWDRMYVLKWEGPK